MPIDEMGSRVLLESPDVRAGVLFATIFGFLLLVALAMVGLWFFLTTSAPNALAPKTERAFPQPALQKSPQIDLRNFEREQQQKLSGRDRGNRDKGLVRIPIDEAMRIIVARGDHAYDPLDPPATPPTPAVESDPQ